MPLRVELGRQWARRRTRLTLGFLAVLPFLLVGAFELGNGSNRRGAPGFVDLATEGAANFTLFTLFAATGFLLVVVFALFSGDTVAGEASWSSLRYLLAAPVPRGQLLRQKLLVASHCRCSRSCSCRQSPTSRAASSSAGRPRARRWGRRSAPGTAWCGSHSCWPTSP